MKRAKVFADENAESINWYLRELSQNPQKFSRGWNPIILSPPLSLRAVALVAIYFDFLLCFPKPLALFQY